MELSDYIITTDLRVHFRLKYQKSIDISVENVYNLFVDIEH